MFFKEKRSSNSHNTFCLRKTFYSPREGLRVPLGFKKGKTVKSGLKTDKQPAITLPAYEELPKSLREVLSVSPDLKKGNSTYNLFYLFENNLEKLILDQKPAMTISEYEKLSNSLREGVPIPKGFKERKLSTTFINNQKPPVIQQQTKIQPITKSSKLPQATKNKNNVQEEEV
ncbi:unnamed protein product [Meloidogyne enterolobii]|uniref:Uncharacterized protein n=1 Tax=Meloidogyne enterolobii TaxID=390850 RepID=A0ACB0ZKL3_MELEN